MSKKILRGLREGLISPEEIYHFRCGICDKWWTIGDAPKNKTWFCPWCGKKQKFRVC